MIRVLRPGRSEPRLPTGPVGLAALDLDGTLLGPGRVFTPRVRAAVAAAEQQGTRVVVVTGRMYRSVLPFIQDLAIHGPIVCYGGALIKDPTSNTTLHHRGVPVALVREVIGYARSSLGLPVNVYLGDDLFVDAVAPHLPGYDYHVRARARPVGDLLTFLAEDPTHVAVVCQPERTKAIVLELRRQFGEQLFVTSGHPLLAEVSHPAVSKGWAIRWLEEHLHIPAGRAIAVGDDWNDITMLQVAGVGVAMGQSPPEVLAAADWIAPPVQEDGAAVAIEELVLRGNT
ncbi:MAG: HAD family phosphatase [Chloroflexi bacterium]|nr:HAD family phosphatase [Chloroflexota bacterium]